MKILDNRIELTGLIQEFSWGQRHLATDLDLQRPLTVTEVHRLAFGATSEARQFVRAAYALSQFTHPNIAQVIGVKRSDDGTVFIVVDHTEGSNLRTIIDRWHELHAEPETAILILAQIARALSAAHDQRDRQTAQPQRLHHLGLNPETIWLAAKGEVRLGEFQFPPEQIRTPAQVAYLAPEQIQGGATDQRTDLFSLGVVGYELCCRKRLFKAENISELMAEILKGEYDLSALAQSKIDRRITSLIEGCLRVNRNDRMVTAAQLADRCESVLREAGAHPEKRLREIVEKVSESPKLQKYPTGRSERIRTRPLERSDLEEGTQAMVEPQRNDRDDEHRARAGQETRISSTPVSERLKRAQRSGLGGNKTIFVLGLVAALLVLVVGVLVVMKLVGGDGASDQVPVVEMKTGTVATVPEGVAVYSADSLLGYTPLLLTLPEGELLTLRHPCCPDSSIILDFDRIAESPYVMKTIVEINSSPVGAKVTLNGQDIGAATPYQFTASASDTIRFTLEMPGKKVLASGPVPLAESGTMSLDGIEIGSRSGGGIRFSGSFSERPKTQIVTYPRGARVKVTSTNLELGTTPLSSDFGDEAVMLQLSLNGFEDGILEIPAIGKRQSTYKAYLFRRVDIQAYEQGHPERTVNANIREVVYDGKTYPGRDVTPASVRLPGIECRIVLTADGYVETDTIVTPLAREFTVLMRKRDASTPKKEEAAPVADGAKGEVRLFVVDDKERPIGNAVVTAEFKVGKEKEMKDLGRTDGNGRIVASLDPAKYKFYAVHPDFKNKDESKEVKAGQTYVVQIKMKRR